MHDSPQHIGILRLSAIGDVCHAVATVQAIRLHFPSARITWVIGRIEAALVGDLPGVEFVVFDKRGGWRELRRVRRHFNEPLDVLLHMQVALRANVLAAVIPARRKIGFPAHLSKELHGLVVNERCTLPPRPHVLEGFQGFAYALGVPRFEPAWNIPVSDEDRQWAEQQIPEGRPVLLISPAASKPERCWTVAGYTAIAEHAIDKGFDVLLTGGPTPWERSLADDIASACASPLRNLAGQTSLKQLLALLGRAAIVLAPDSGPAHMATTQGTPVIGLYAHSNPERTGPYNSRHSVVETYYSSIEQQYGVTASALPWGVRAKGKALMQAISIAAVCEQFDRLAGMYGER